MKVPIYKAQTGPVKTGNQAMRTAFADPGMIGSAAGAEAQKWDAYKKIGMQVAATELGIERQTKVLEHMKTIHAAEAEAKKNILTGEYPSSS